MVEHGEVDEYGAEGGDDGDGRARPGGGQRRFEIFEACRTAWGLLSKSTGRLMGIYLLFVVTATVILVPVIWLMVKLGIGVEELREQVICCGSVDVGYQPDGSSSGSSGLDCDRDVIAHYPAGLMYGVFVFVVLVVGRYYRGVALKYLDDAWSASRRGETARLEMGRLWEGAGMFGRLARLGVLKWAVLGAVMSIGYVLLVEGFGAGVLLSGPPGPVGWAIISVGGVAVAGYLTLMLFAEAEAVISRDEPLIDAVARAWSAVSSLRRAIYTLVAGLFLALCLMVPPAVAVALVVSQLGEPTLGVQAVGAAAGAGVGLMVVPVVAVVGYAMYRSIRVE